MNQEAPNPNLRIDEPLGTGGTAEVHKAYHRQLNRTVAVKQWLTEGAGSRTDFERLIQRERDLIGFWRFPGLVRVIDEPEANRHRLLLEYCPGPTLDRAGRPGNLAVALNIISALAVDLEFLRLVGIVHGDLKPQNVFLPQDRGVLDRGGLTFVKLSDFSLGRRVDEGPEARLGLGTIGYMAPETIADGRTTHRSDLFALGIIAYQLLSGQHPFLTEDAEPVKVNSRIREQDPVSLTELNSELPSEVAAVVVRLLNRDPAARPASAWDTCLELEAAGATYPFREALRPAFLFPNRPAYDSCIETCLSLKGDEAAQLSALTGGLPARLRLLLTANYLRKRLIYGSGRFRFSDNIYWPHRLRNDLLRKFGRSPFGIRRAAVVEASLGSREIMNETGPTRPPGTPEPADALAPLLAPLLRVGTVKRQAARHAAVAENRERYDIAARLYLRSGELDQAERCADLAAREFSRSSRNDDALDLLRQLDFFAHSADKEFEIRRCLLLKGNLHKENGELDAAEQLYDRIIALYRNRPADKLLAETHKNVGEVLRLRQDSQSALAALERALAVFRELNDELEISHTLVNIGNVHWIANETRHALRSYRAAYKIQERLEAQADLASTLHNIASIYCLDGRTRRGIFLLKHALKLKKEIGHQGEIARTLNNLGYAYQIAGQPATAADYITESLEINRRIGSKKELLYNFENLASLQIASGQLQKAANLLQEGQLLAAEHVLVAHQANFYLHAATIAKRLGRFDEATRSLARVDDLLPELDDHALDMLTTVQKASLRYHLGDNPGALKLAREVYAGASTTNNVVPELDSLLLIVRLTDDEECWTRANAIVDGRRLVREKRLLTFGRIEYLLDHNESEAARELASGVVDRLNEIEQDLERAWMEALAGRICLEEGQESTAHRHLSRGLTASQKTGLLPELITLHVLLGKLAKSKGEYEAAFASFKQALEAGREVANTIIDVGDRQLYRKKPILQFLASEISTLSRQLGNRQRAGR